MAARTPGKSPSGIKYAKNSCNLVELMPPKDAYRFEQNFTYELSKTEDAPEARRAHWRSASRSSRGASQQGCRVQPHLRRITEIPSPMATPIDYDAFRREVTEFALSAARQSSGQWSPLSQAVTQGVVSLAEDSA